MRRTNASTIGLRLAFVRAPLLTAIALLVVLGTVHGVYTDRWGKSGQLEQSVAAIDRVPMTFGDWVGTDLPYQAEDMTRAGISGTVLRRYKNTRSRESVSVLLVCGRGGPISVHTPEVCYAGTGYRQINDAAQQDVDLGADGRHAFRLARFSKPGGVTPSVLDVHWAWSRDGLSWETPENPRVTLSRTPALYKLYVVRECLPGTRPDASDPCREFLRQGLPEIQRALVSIER